MKQTQLHDNSRLLLPSSTVGHAHRSRQPCLGVMECQLLSKCTHLRPVFRLLLAETNNDLHKEMAEDPDDPDDTQYLHVSDSLFRGTSIPTCAQIPSPKLCTKCAQIVSQVVYCIVTLLTSCVCISTERQSMGHGVRTHHCLFAPSWPSSGSTLYRPHIVQCVSVCA